MKSDFQNVVRFLETHARRFFQRCKFEIFGNFLACMGKAQGKAPF